MKTLDPKWTDVTVENECGGPLIVQVQIRAKPEPAIPTIIDNGDVSPRTNDLIEVRTPPLIESCQQPCLVPESPKQPYRKDKRMFTSSLWEGPQGVKQVLISLRPEDVKDEDVKDRAVEVRTENGAQWKVETTPRDQQCKTPSEPESSMVLRDGRQSRRSSNAYLTHSTFHLTQQTPPPSQPDTAGIPWCAVGYTPEKEKLEQSDDSQSGSPISSASRQSLSTEKNRMSHCRQRISCRSYEESPPDDSHHNEGLPVLSESENAFSDGRESGRTGPPIIAVEKAVGTEDLRAGCLPFSYTPEKLQGFELWESPDWKNFHSLINWEVCGPHYGNTVVFRRSMRTAYFDRPAVWKGWDGKHFPPTNFYEAAVIWFTVDAARDHVESVTLARSHKDDEWKLAGRHDLRKGPGIMEAWVQINYWWLVKSPTHQSGTAPVIYLDLTGITTNTPLACVPNRQSCHELRIASLHHLRARIDPFIRRRNKTNQPN